MQVTSKILIWLQFQSNLKSLYKRNCFTILIQSWLNLEPVPKVVQLPWLRVGLPLCCSARPPPRPRPQPRRRCDDADAAPEPSWLIKRLMLLFSSALASYYSCCSLQRHLPGRLGFRVTGTSSLQGSPWHWQWASLSCPQRQRRQAVIVPSKRPGSYYAERADTKLSRSRILAAGPLLWDAGLSGCLMIRRSLIIPDAAWGEGSSL